MTTRVPDGGVRGDLRVCSRQVELSVAQGGPASLVGASVLILDNGRVLEQGTEADGCDESATVVDGLEPSSRPALMVLPFQNPF